jgi:hypothetical protein
MNPLSPSTRTVATYLVLSADRAALQARYGQVWDTSELAGDFEVLEFAAPFVIARRTSDRKLGSLLFQHAPRLYFSFEEDSLAALPSMGGASNSVIALATIAAITTRRKMRPATATIPWSAGSELLGLATSRQLLNPEKPASRVGIKFVFDALRQRREWRRNGNPIN